MAMHHLHLSPNATTPLPVSYSRSRQANHTLLSLLATDRPLLLEVRVSQPEDFSSTLENGRQSMPMSPRQRPSSRVLPSSTPFTTQMSSPPLPSFPKTHVHPKYTAQGMYMYLRTFHPQKDLQAMRPPQPRTPCFARHCTQLCAGEVSQGRSAGCWKPCPARNNVPRIISYRRSHGTVLYEVPASRTRHSNLCSPLPTASFPKPSLRRAIPVLVLPLTVQCQGRDFCRSVASTHATNAVQATQIAGGGLFSPGKRR